MSEKRKSKSDLTNLSKVFESETDPDGMYTGVTTAKKYDEPVQDADDL